MGALKDAIRANGQTISGVARRIKVNRATVEGWDRGLGITPENQRALEDVVGVPLPFLTVGRGWAGKPATEKSARRSGGKAEDAILLEIAQLERRIEDVEGLRRRVVTLRAALDALGDARR